MRDRPRIRCPGCRGVVRVTAEGFVPGHQSPAGERCTWGREPGVYDCLVEFVVGVGEQQSMFGATG